MKIVECVPNFSEGRDEKVINAIATSIQNVEGVKLLNVDPGADTNRTVVTFIGDPESVKEAAFQAIKKAAELIDMRKHSGEHARIGATDVCPFIPVAGVTMEDCVNIAKQVGQRVAEELHIPVYLYEEAATRPERKNLADIRKGEYEGLPEKLKDPEWKPDFGEPEFNAKSGATVIGARKFLIAYNVNLNTKDRKLAHEIALNIRESGRSKRDENGKIIRDADGKPIKVPGSLKACKAVGWYIEEYGQAQVSMNLTDFEQTPVHIAFEEVVKEANKLGLRVTGSELVGLIPLQALLDAGKFYYQKQGKSAGQPEKELIQMAIKSMGLNDITPFDPLERIIEYQIEPPAGPLASKTVADFVDVLSTDVPAPGGGSVAALLGSLAAALGSMVSNLTVGNKSYQEFWPELTSAAEKFQELKKSLIKAIDKDTDAFNALMNAFRLPKKTEEQIAEREKAIEEATKGAVSVPFSVAEESLQIIKQLNEKLNQVNKNAISDLGVGLLCAEAAVQGAALNVMINLKDITDDSYKQDVFGKIESILNEATRVKEEGIGNVYGIIVKEDNNA